MKRRHIAIFAAAVMAAGNVFPAFAGQWQWLDPNQDGITECYYFDDNGTVPVNTVTPDGYTVDGNGAWTVNGVAQTRGTAGTGEEYPLAGMLEQFGLNDTGYSDPMIASANGAWLPYTGKYQYINSGSSNLAAVAAVLAGEPYRDFEGKVLDPIQYLADANSLTCDQANQMIGMIRDFLNSFDWKRDENRYGIIYVPSHEVLAQFGIN